MNYAKSLPKDTQGTGMQEYPAPVKALTSYAATVTVSSVVTLTDNTTALEVAAIGVPVVMRWIATTDTQASVIGSGAGTNFDHIVLANSRRRFVVPIETSGTSSVVGVNKKFGLYNRVAWNVASTGGSASVFGTEY